VAALSQTEVTPDKIVVELLTDMQGDLLKRRVDGASKCNHRRFDESNVTAISKILSALAKFKRKHKITEPTELLGNEEFYNFVEVEISAPRYFDNSLEFKEAVNLVLRGGT
jgi:hypothetical protein